MHFFFYSVLNENQITLLCNRVVNMSLTSFFALQVTKYRQM